MGSRYKRGASARIRPRYLQGQVRRQSRKPKRHEGPPASNLLLVYSWSTMNTRARDLMRVVPRGAWVFWTGASLVLASISAGFARWLPVCNASPWNPVITAAIATLFGILAFWIVLCLCSADW